MLMTGLGSGIDYESMIAAIVGAERAPKANQLARQEGMNHAEKNALQEIQFTINSFRDKVEDLNSSRELQKLKAELSNDDVLSASVDSNAVTGEYNFEVTQLARAERAQLFKVAEGSTFTEGKFSFTTDSGPVEVDIVTLKSNLDAEQVAKKQAHKDQVYKEVAEENNIALTDPDFENKVKGALAADPEQQTSFDNQQKVYDDEIARLNTEGVKLEEIQTAINGHANSDGVKATLVRSNGDISMVLNAKDTGTVNAIGAITFTTPLKVRLDGVGSSTIEDQKPLQTAQNAKVMFGSMELISSTNKMENAIDGISLNLKAKGTVNVKVERDEASVNSTIKSFVEDYNKIIETVNTYTKSSEDKAAALSGSSATRSMVSRLRGVIGAEYGKSDNNTLASLGITTNREGGTLKIDQKKLDKALEDDFDAVSKLFLGDESNSQVGMMDQMMLVLDDYHKNGGTYDRRIDQLEYNNKQIAEDREKLDSRMEAKTLSLRAYYARMDSQIAQMNQTQNMLVSMLM